MSGADAPSATYRAPLSAATMKFRVSASLSTTSTTGRGPPIDLLLFGRRHSVRRAAGTSAHPAVRSFLMMANARRSPCRRSTRVGPVSARRRVRVRRSTIASYCAVRSGKRARSSGNVTRCRDTTIKSRTGRSRPESFGPLDETTVLKAAIGSHLFYVRLGKGYCIRNGRRYLSPG